MLQDELELQSLSHLQAAIPALDCPGTTPETIFSETDIATPEYVVRRHETNASKDMDEGDEND